LNETKTKWSFQDFEKYLANIEFLQKDNLLNKKFISFIKDNLLIKSDNKLKWKLFKIYESSLLDVWLGINKKHFYENGSYTRIYEESSLVKAIVNPQLKKWNEKEISIITSQLKNKKLFEYHIVWFLIQSSNFDFLKRIDGYQNIINKIEKTFENQNSNLFQKWIAYLYFSEIENYSMVIETYKLIGKYKFQVESKLIYSKALFKASQLEEAYSIIKDLLKIDFYNLKYLNYAGIIAVELERFDEAENYFTTLQELYPNNLESKFNRNLFLEKKYRAEIKHNWEEYNNSVEASNV